MEYKLELLSNWQFSSPFYVGLMRMRTMYVASGGGAKCQQPPWSVQPVNRSTTRTLADQDLRGCS